MTEQHPITPSQELINKWARFNENGREALWKQIATQAAQWGADQELEACCKWLIGVPDFYNGAEIDLRAYRRPKPPSLKEKALAALKRQSTRSVPSLATTNDCDTIRRALEALPND